MSCGPHQEACKGRKRNDGETEITVVPLVNQKSGNDGESAITFVPLVEIPVGDTLQTRPAEKRGNTLRRT